MSYTAPGTIADGEVLTAAQLNITKAALDYLAGKDGAVLREDVVLWANDTNFGGSINGLNPSILLDTGNDYVLYNRALEKWQFTSGGTIIAKLNEDGIEYSTGYFSLQGIGPRRHIEAGTSSTESVANEAENEDAFTFTKPYTHVPNVAMGLMAGTITSLRKPSVHIKTNTLTTTGVTLTKRNGGTGGAMNLTTYYIAEGRD